MLITTYNGILVNTPHIACVAIKRHVTDRNNKLEMDSPSRHKVILFLAGGDPIVVADRLTRADAEFLRKEIAHHWVEGSALLDVATSLAYRKEGAYPAEEVKQTTT